MPTEKKLIPRFSTPSRQSREIDGQLVSISRLPARRAPAVLSRLLADVGDVVAEILASPDRELDPEIEASIRVMLTSTAGVEKAVGASIGVIKAVIFSNALSKVKTFDIGWYTEEMLPGSLEIAGVKIDTMAELEETGITPMPLMALLWFATQVNFFPTSGDPDTSIGSESPDQTTPPAPAPSPSRTTGKSSLRGASAKAGQLVQT